MARRDQVAGTQPPYSQGRVRRRNAETVGPPEEGPPVFAALTDELKAPQCKTKDVTVADTGRAGWEVMCTIKAVDLPCSRAVLLIRRNAELRTLGDVVPRGGEWEAVPRTLSARLGTAAYLRLSELHCLSQEGTSALVCTSMAGAVDAWANRKLTTRPGCVSQTHNWRGGAGFRFRRGSGKDQRRRSLCAK